MRVTVSLTSVPSVTHGPKDENSRIVFIVRFTLAAAESQPLDGKGSPGVVCLQRVDEGPIVVSTLGRARNAPTPGLPSDFGTPPSAPLPEPCLGRAGEQN